jgi:hypothetical protein
VVPVLAMFGLLCVPAEPMRAQAAGAQTPDALTAWIQWGGTLNPDPRGIRELTRYGEAAGAPLDPEYAGGLITRIHENLLSSARARVARLLEGVCEPSFQVTFGPSAGPFGSTGASGVLEAVRFEEGLVNVEVVACLTASGARAEEALAIYTSPDFRMAAEGRIRSVREQGDESCVETAGTPGLLSPSHACNRIRRFVGGPIASEHSQVVLNVDPHSFQVVYLKESLKTFVMVPGGVALHYVNHSRTVELGRLGRWAAARSIRDSEARKAAALQARLGVANPSAPQYSSRLHFADQGSLPTCPESATPAKEASGFQLAKPVSPTPMLRVGTNRS